MIGNCTLRQRMDFLFMLWQDGSCHTITAAARESTWSADSASIFQAASSSAPITEITKQKHGSSFLLQRPSMSSPSQQWAPKRKNVATINGATLVTNLIKASWTAYTSMILKWCPRSYQTDHPIMCLHRVKRACQFYRCQLSRITLLLYPIILLFLAKRLILTPKWDSQPPHDFPTRMPYENAVNPGTGNIVVTLIVSNRIYYLQISVRVLVWQEVPCTTSDFT